MLFVPRVSFFLLEGEEDLCETPNFRLENIENKRTMRLSCPVLPVDRREIPCRVEEGSAHRRAMGSGFPSLPHRRVFISFSMCMCTLFYYVCRA